jgi:hypothetical protein
MPLNKTGSHLKGPCSSPDIKLEVGEEQLYALNWLGNKYEF